MFLHLDRTLTYISGITTATVVLRLTKLLYWMTQWVRTVPYESIIKKYKIKCVERVICFQSKTIVTHNLHYLTKHCF